MIDRDVLENQNDTITSAENMILDKVNRIQDLEEKTKDVKDDISAKVDVEAEESVDKSLSNEGKRSRRKGQLLREHDEYTKMMTQIKDHERAISSEAIRISTAKRKFNIMLAFARESGEGK